MKILAILAFCVVGAASSYASSSFGATGFSLATAIAQPVPDASTTLPLLGASCGCLVFVRRFLKR